MYIGPAMSIWSISAIRRIHNTIQNILSLPILI